MASMCIHFIYAEWQHEKTLPCLMLESCHEIADMPNDKQLRLDVPSLAER